MYYKYLFILLMTSFLLNLTGCSFITRVTLLTSISVEGGSNCKNIIVRKKVSMDIIATGPLLIPFIPLYIFDQSTNKKKVVSCITDKVHLIKEIGDAYYWYDSGCKYKVGIETDYKYFPLVAIGGTDRNQGSSKSETITCFSYSDLQ